MITSFQSLFPVVFGFKSAKLLLHLKCERNAVFVPAAGQAACRYCLTESKMLSTHLLTANLPNSFYQKRAYVSREVPPVISVIEVVSIHQSGDACL